MTNNIKLNDGGRAFPVWELNGQGKPEMTGFGMTLRDYFAAKAMQGIAANPETCDMTAEEAAELAYNVADAMLATREQGESEAECSPAASSETVNVIGMPEFDGLLDHIYEHGTAAEGVIEKANAFARAIIARYAPQQLEASTMCGDLIETLQDCANALDELLPRDHAYRKIVEQANRLLAMQAAEALKNRREDDP